MENQQLIKEIKTVEYFDKRRYKFTFLDNAVRYIASVTTKLEEYREQGIERYRETVGPEEANRAFEEGGEWGGIVHHACFLLATGGAVLYEPPAYQTVGIENEEVAALIKQNVLICQQLAVRKIPYLKINDQFLADGSGAFWNLDKALKHFDKLSNKNVHQVYVHASKTPDTELIAECQPVRDSFS